MFWQWINQTWNAAFNYHNRNTTNAESTNEIEKAYAIASTTSVATAVGLNTLVTKLPFKNYFLKMISYRFVPYFACCAASSFNAIIMRYKELMKGVELTDNEGNSYGISKKAGQIVIKSIVCSRVVLPIPGVLLPPLLMNLLRYCKLAPSGKIAGFLFDTCLCVFTCTIGLPIAVSLYPSWMSINSSELEEEFRNICDAHGKVIDKFIVSKGV